MQLVRLILVALVLAGVSACNSPVRSVAQGCAPSYDLNVDASFYASSTPVSHRYEQCRKARELNGFARFFASRRVLVQCLDLNRTRRKTHFA